MHTRAKELEEARSRERRARRKQIEQELRESRALREAAERRLDATLTPLGVLMRARVI